MFRTALPIGLCLLLAAAGCSDDDENPRDASTGADSSTQTDQGSEVDQAAENDQSTETDGSDDDGSGDDADDSPSCEEYCTAVQAACTSDNEQHASQSACLSYCKDASGWDKGSRDETSGNTVACRLTHAGLASGDPATHCPHAGPSGDNVCGTWCEVYCDLVDTVCTGDDEITFDPDCATECADYPTSGSSGDASGDTVQCRITHAGLGAAAPDVHCPHASPSGDGVCVDE